MGTVIEVDAQKAGQWWALEFAAEPAVRYTQAETIDRIEEMVRDICELDGVAVGEIHVRINLGGSL